MYIDLIQRAVVHKVRSLYGYVPTGWIAIVFIALFSVSTVIHIGQGIKFRTWWVFFTVVVAGALEVLGWGARLWSSHSPTALKPYLMQISCTILAPTFFVAGNFIILGAVIRQLGPVYSRISPWWYTIFFCSFDVVSLIVQATGGGIASIAVEQHRNPLKGGNIMLGGIAFQMASMVFYVICASEFLVRYFRDRPIASRVAPEGTSAEEKERVNFRGVLDGRTKIMLGSLVFSTLCLFVRAVYRTIELNDGFSGRIITTEVYFNVLDGAMITLAMYTMNFAHPGWLLNSVTSGASRT
ncbi:RTA1-like protein [Mycena floridula]|nr:RTA1-like protein [Mycena floridula]